MDQQIEFRDGQYEAIEATLTNKRTLVVQKTGWGKSLVYFLSTKYNRSLKKGVTLIVVLISTYGESNYCR